MKKAKNNTLKKVTKKIKNFNTKDTKMKKLKIQR
jgi:hypothetical protein